MHLLAEEKKGIKFLKIPKPARNNSPKARNINLTPSSKSSLSVIPKKSPVSISKDSVRKPIESLKKPKENVAQSQVKEIKDKPKQIKKIELQKKSISLKVSNEPIKINETN